MTTKQVILILTIICIPACLGFLLESIKPQNNAIFSSTKKIGIVYISDIILSSEEYVKQLQSFRKDNTIAGVLLRINSPGGAVAPSQEIYEEVLQFRSCKKPIIVSMGNIAASGGYYIASAASKIFASSGTITGSIGVIIQFPHYYKLLDKIGVDITTIKAGKLKDVGNPTRKLSESESAFFQNFINTQHEQFIDDVSIGRNMNTETIRPLADGRILTGKQAKEAGLIDSIGGYTKALEYLKEMLHLPEKTKIVEKNQYPTFLDEFIGDKLSLLFSVLKFKNLPAGSYFLYAGDF